MNAPVRVTTYQSPFDQGFSAKGRKLSIHACPHPENTMNRIQWQHGWNMANIQSSQK